MDNVTETMENVNPLVTNEILINITNALIILLIGFTIGKLLGIAIFKLLNGVEFDKGLNKISNSKFHASKTISSTISLLIYIATVIFALITLNILGITFLIISYFILILVLGTVLLGIIFSIPNIVTGTKIRKKLKIGNRVELNGVRGEIIKIGILNTKIKGEKNELFVVPNKLFKKYKKY